jgi:hypothetical protein
MGIVSQWQVVTPGDPEMIREMWDSAGEGPRADGKQSTHKQVMRASLRGLVLNPARVAVRISGVHAILSP